MSVKPFKWDNAEWAIVENKYGKLLSYNLERYHNGYMNLSYQGYITEMLESGKYEIFIDVGAYIGLFSQIASYHCQKVVAYEAHPFYYGILLFNMRYFHNVDCRYKFVSVEGEIPKIDDDVKGLVVFDEGISYNIEVVSLDTESGCGIHFSTLIKLDVEGSEIDVLEGSKKLLKNSNIHWIIDVHTNRGIVPQDVLEYFPNRKITMISQKVIKVDGLE